MSKKSIRFYKDHKVRAVWNEDGNHWWFSVLDIVGAIRNQRAMDFLDWFTYSNNTIDGQSRKKAYTLWEGNLVADKDVGTVKALQQIYAYLFGELDMIFKKRMKICVDWSRIDKRDYLDAMIASHTDSSRIHKLLKGAMTDKIDDREIFMKGIDYSYYYEQKE